MELKRTSQRAIECTYDFFALVHLSLALVTSWKCSLRAALSAGLSSPPERAQPGSDSLPLPHPAPPPTRPLPISLLSEEREPESATRPPLQALAVEAPVEAPVYAAGAMEREPAPEPRPVLVSVCVRPRSARTIASATVAASNGSSPEEGELRGALAGRVEEGPSSSACEGCRNRARGRPISYLEIGSRRGSRQIRTARADSGGVQNTTRLLTIKTPLN